MTDTKQKGILIRGVGGLYGVRPLPLSPGASICLCRARGVFRHENITPLPGDTVLFSRDSDAPLTADNRDAEYVIDEILPRRNTLVRPPLANLTHLFLMIPAARPAPDTVTADKLIAIAEVSGIEPVIVISKEDLDPEKAEELAARFADELFVSTTFFLEFYDYTRPEFENCYKILQFLSDISDHFGNAELASSIRDRFNQLVESWE